MPVTKTIELLPAIFRSEANKKFLNATLDQLVAEPSLTRFSGYVGRTFAPSYKYGDSYITEPSADRKNYQLEPSIVVRNQTSNEVEFHVTYPELLQKLKYYGVNVNNQNSLWESDYYTYNPHIDWDKFINFNQYYWLPNGPDAVDVFSGSVDLEKKFEVTRNSTELSYNFSGFYDTPNPDIILARGGEYRFEVNQTGRKFWIQSTPGLSGRQTVLSNLSSRAVLGVSNNGAETGAVIFRVPNKAAQDFYLNMPKLQDVDFASDLQYVDIQNQLLSSFIDKHGGFDGQRTAIDGKFLVFVQPHDDDGAWTPGGNYDHGKYDKDGELFDQGQTIQNSQRYGIWKITLVPSDSANTDYIINLVFAQSLPDHNKIFVKSGVAYGGTDWYKNATGYLEQFPILTANLDTLYYQDSVDASIVGVIRLVDPGSSNIDIESDILGKKNYVSPNGVVFTNGLKINFDSAVVPETYRNKSYYVEGVGDSITLTTVESLGQPYYSISSGDTIDVNDIIGKLSYTSPNKVKFTNGMWVVFPQNTSPISYANRAFIVQGVSTGAEDTVNHGITLTQTKMPPYMNHDYVVINRSSQEKSKWACGNKWFHKDIVRLTALYNNTTPVYEQNSQAHRPVIEFEPNLQLYDFGSTAKTPVDIYDTTTTTPFLTVEKARINTTLSSGVYLDGVELTAGMRVVFANDADPITRNNIWVVSFFQDSTALNAPYYIHLELATDGEVADGSVISVNQGKENSGKYFWFRNNTWDEGQVKHSVNQSPLFDVFDLDGISFGDQGLYPRVTVSNSFNGTKLFSYALGTGPVDSVLGIPLEYRNVNNIGDIVFSNDFDKEQFQYSIDRNNYVVKVNTGCIKKNLVSGGHKWVNNWVKVNKPTRQMQTISYLYDGARNVFFCDVLPKEETDSPTLLVYVDHKLLARTDYITDYVGDGLNLYINTALLRTGSKIDIFVDSDSVSATGFYQVPLNLDLNAQNSTFKTLTLGEIRNHIKTLVTNTNKFRGPYPGGSNLRDTTVSSSGGNVLQHESGIPYAAMLLTDDKMNFVTAATQAATEYSRFKYKFLELASNIAEIAVMVNNGQTAAAIDELLSRINSVKNKTFPWYYSDMVPYGKEKNVITYKVFNTSLKVYEITNRFSLATPSNSAVLVYHGDQILVYGRDYTFSKTSASVIISDGFSLVSNEVLTIVEFSNTDGCFIPETPSKLGLYPKFIPGVVVDSTYSNTVTMLRGHDGSQSPIFGDFRDNLLLELETRIYNNIKTDYDSAEFGIHDVVPGKFRQTGYSLSEFNNILSKYFMQWVGNNRLDFMTNNTWNRDNPFTWNYRNLPDTIDGSLLSGSWRACYQYFYDTQTPHLTPWEMLGFSEKPTWWESYYGPAPYTGGNLIMWKDLAKGYIADGARKGIDARYVRPDLLNVIPVDVSGNLLPPAGVMTRDSSETTNRVWSVGNLGPVETAWMKSSEYPFALQCAMAVSKPAKYFGLNINKQLTGYDQDLDQFMNLTTRQRLVQDDVIISGEIVNGVVLRSAGVLNWVSDALRSIGISPEVSLKHYLSNYEVNLSYRIAGYSDKKYLKVLAEQYSPNSFNETVLVPDSDYDLVLSKSTPIKKISYSAVILEKTDNGYRVSGYNTSDPVFTVIPPEPTGESYDIAVLDQSVRVYKRYKRLRVTVPYGHEFANVQQVANFLMGYGLYLTSQGFRFDAYDQDLEEIRNWALSIKEMLFWSQQGWSSNSVIVLSPVADSVKVAISNAVVDSIKNSITGSRVLNQNFRILGPQDITVMRDSNIFTCSLVTEEMIGLIELNLVQYEHAMIFNNQTMFNDIIYRPEMGMRQARLKLHGFKTRNWTGNLDPNGFIYNDKTVPAWQPMKDYLKGDLVAYKDINYTAKVDIAGTAEFDFNMWARVAGSIKSGLLPNMATGSSVSETFYDVDNVNLETQYDQFGKGLIGYKNRGYLDMLGLDDISKVKFYQGFIKEKGTHNAFNALANVSFNNIENQVSMSEEWAFRVGEYGGLDISQYVDLELSDQDVLSNPFSVQVTTGSSDADMVIRTPYKSSVMDFSAPMFINRENNSIRTNDVQVAGFVNAEDIDITVFDFNKFEVLNDRLDKIGTGTRIWCAKDFNYSWNVYRVSETGVTVTTITNALDGLIKLTTAAPHGLEAGGILLVKNAEQFSGFYKIISTPSIDSFVVNYGKDLRGFTRLTELVSPVYSLDSMRYEYSYQVAEQELPSGWHTGDKVWITNNELGSWGVYEKISPWNFESRLPVSAVKVNGATGTAVNLSADNSVALVGRPSSGTGGGEVTVYVRTTANRFIEQRTIVPTDHRTAGFGAVIDQGTWWAVVGAPNSINGTGQAFALYRTPLDATVEGVIPGTTAIQQMLMAPDLVSGSEFGASVSMSADDQWIYVGAPGSDAVYVYGYVDNIISAIDVVSVTKKTTNGYTRVFGLNFVLDSEDPHSVTVSSMTKTYIPYVDYILRRDIMAIEFTIAPLNEDIVVRRESGYRYVDKITGTTGTKFGASVSCATEGAQVVIGAPNDSMVLDAVVAPDALVFGRTYRIASVGTTDFTLVGAAVGSIGEEFVATGLTTGTGTVNEVLVKSGAAYVYDRSVEAFNATGVETIFDTVRPVNIVSKVKVNGVKQGRKYSSDSVFTYEINNLGQIQFDVPPVMNSVVAIETNKFELLEKCVPSEPQAYSKFGYAVNLCPTNCSIYIGAPDFNDTRLQCGVAYRFFNQGRTIGTNTGTVHNPVINSGDSIRINDFEVQFVNTDLDSVVAAINAKDIPGVIAINDRGYLKLVSDNKITRSRLRVLAGDGSAIQDLGLVVYPEAQVIRNPIQVSNGKFGKKIRITRTLPDTTLLIGSDQGTTIETTIIDGGDTKFDTKSTNFEDRIQNSGAVFVYTYMNDARVSVSFPAGKLAFAQQLVPTDGSLSIGDGFGFDFDIQDDTVLVGAPTSDYVQPEVLNVSEMEIGERYKIVSLGTTDFKQVGARAYNVGEVFVAKAAGTGTGTVCHVVPMGDVYEFMNPTRKLGWDLIRSEEPKVDIDSINKFYLWSKNSNTIISTLDYIDPAKGKILGVAEQEIKYKTVYDPASYTTGGSNVNVNALRHWSDKQVGQVWWNLDTVRFIDYEQGSIQYRTTNWGKMFPGSEVQVCEWVESLYLPSEYVANGGNGVPLYADDSAYSEITLVDPLSNQEYSKYYFWVKDKTTVDQNQFGRTIPVLSVKHLIENPKGQGIMHAAAIKNDAIGLYNCSSKVVGTDTVLHVDYDTKINSSVIHSEWELATESAEAGISKLPERIFGKMLDSLAGVDSFGNTVPDPRLAVQNRYGIDIRPRQSMFIDSRAALKTLVDHMNSWFASVPLSLMFNIAELAAKEPFPPENSGIWNTRVPNIETLGYVDVSTLDDGYTVLVESDSTVENLWTIYTRKDREWFLSRVQSYNDDSYWAYVDWYADGYSASTVPDLVVKTTADLSGVAVNPNSIIKILNDGSGNFRCILVTATSSKTVGIQNGTVKFDRSLYDLESAGMGFDNDNFDAKRYDQNPSLEIRSMLSVLFNDVLVGQYASQNGKIIQLIINYILTEQKYVDWMFKTSFVNVLHKIRKLNQPSSYTKDNQDFYLDYLEEVKPYRTTVREYVVNYDGTENLNGYVTDFDVPAYYDTVLDMQRSPSGEFYQDVTALTRPEYTDWVNTYTYSIEPGADSIGVSSSRRGKGYTTPPVIKVVGSAIGNDAIAEPIFNYNTGELSGINVTKLGTGYIGRSTIGSTMAPTVHITGGGLPFVSNPFAPGLSVTAGQYVKTSHLQYFVVTQSGALGAEPRYLDNLVVGVSVIHNGTAVMRFAGEEAVAYINLTNNTTRKISTTLIFDRITYGSKVKVWEPNTEYVAGDIVSFNSVPYIATKDFTSGDTFNGNLLDVYTAEFTNANDRIMARYSLSAGSPGKSLAALQNGISYPGVRITGPLFSDSPFFDSTAFDSIAYDSVEIMSDGTVSLSQSLVDTIVTSQYTDANLNPPLGERPEDINIDGGKYIDEYSSHAPEELIPGRVYDTLDIQVYQNTTPVISFRQFKDMTGKVEFLRIANDNNTILVSDLNLNDTEVFVADTNMLATPGPATGTPGVIFINGERITYYGIDLSRNALTHIRRATGGTGAKAHISGSLVVDGSVNQLVPGSGDEYQVAAFKTHIVDSTGSVVYTDISDGEKTVFESTTTNLVSTGVTAASKLYLTQKQYDSLTPLFNDIHNNRFEGLNDMVGAMTSVYVGGSLLRYDTEAKEYSIELVPTLYLGNTVYLLKLTLTNPAPKGTWVAIEIRTNKIWFNPDLIGVNQAIALVNSDTQQAEFLKNAAGVLL